MTDIEIDEISRELSRFGKTAAATFEQWRRHHPEASKAPTWLWKEMNRQDKKDRAATRLRVRQQLREQAATRDRMRAETKAELTGNIDVHRDQVLALNRNPGGTDDFQRQQWELGTDRAHIEYIIQQTPGLSPEQRGQAVTALDAAHHAHLPGVKPLQVWSDRPPYGMTALKARVADRLSRIKLGLVDRGRSITAHRRARDRAAAANPARRRAELDRMIAVTQRAKAVGVVHAERFPSPHEPGDRFPIFDVDKHLTRNVREFDHRIEARIDTAGFNYAQWRTYREAVRDIPEHELHRARNMSTEDLQASYALHATPDWIQRVEADRDNHRGPQHLEQPEQADRSMLGRSTASGTRGHGQGEREWSPEEAEWFGPAMNREQLRAAFGRVNENALNDIHGPDGFGWSEDIEKIRYTLDHHGGALTDGEADRIRGVMNTVVADAKRGIGPDRDLWTVATDDSEYRRWREHPARLLNDSHSPRAEGRRDDNAPHVPDLSRSTLRQPEPVMDAVQVGTELGRVADELDISESERARLFQHARHVDDFTDRGEVDRWARDSVIGWRGNQITDLEEALDNTRAMRSDDLQYADEIAIERDELAARYAVAAQERADAHREVEQISEDRSRIYEYSNDLAEQFEQQKRRIEELTSERDQFRTERDEAVRKLVRSTPQRDRYGSKTRVEAEQRQPSQAGRTSAQPQQAERVNVPFVFGDGERERLRTEPGEWERLVQQRVPESHREYWLSNRDEVLDRHAQLEKGLHAALKNTNSQVMRSKANELFGNGRSESGANQLVGWWVDSGETEYRNEQRAQAERDRNARSAVLREGSPGVRDRAEDGRGFGEPVNGDRPPEQRDRQLVPERNGAHGMKWEGFSR